MNFDIEIIEETLRKTGDNYSIGEAEANGKKVIVGWFLPEHLEQVLAFAKTLEPQATLNETIAKIKLETGNQAPSVS